MTEAEFFRTADALAKEAGVEQGQHRYFLTHRHRIWATGAHFDLWTMRDTSILEIGPFFSYVPFILHSTGNRVTVLEGDDPAVKPLDPLYRSRNIGVTIADLFENFGAADLSRHRLPFGDNQFDAINCWETMEHFNFNPVGFVKEVLRILKPGGRAFITVPNVAKLDWRIRLMFGKPIGPLVSSYYEFYSYHGGKFLGWHWREYVLGEFAELFSRGGFQIERARHLLTFSDLENMGLGRKLKRLLGGAMFQVFPSTGTICALNVRKGVA